MVGQTQTSLQSACPLLFSRRFHSLSLSLPLRPSISSDFTRIKHPLPVCLCLCLHLYVSLSANKIQIEHNRRLVRIVFLLAHSHTHSQSEGGHVMAIKPTSTSHLDTMQGNRKGHGQAGRQTGSQCLHLPSLPSPCVSN